MSAVAKAAGGRASSMGSTGEVGVPLGSLGAHTEFRASRQLQSWETPPTLRRLIRARDLIQARVEEGVSVVDLAKEAGLSRAHFVRAFGRVFGVSPHEYLTGLRMAQARVLLARGASVTEACFSVGFSSLGTFSRTFAARVGESPRTWQRRVRVVLPSAELWPALWVPGCFLVAHGGFEALGALSEKRSHP